ncbi:MAG: 6-phospho-3-hexuloisomerase [Candidatus Micrarchaeia archaeon]
MTLLSKMGKLIEKISENCQKISVQSAEEFITAIMSARRVFVMGMGRSGLVARAFAMRLMHLRLTVFVVGETTTPAIGSGDLLIIVSGSGSTTSVVAIAKKARELGARLAAITSYPDSAVGRLSDVVVKIEGRLPEKRHDYPSRQLAGEHEPLTPMGTLFELATMIFLDTVIEELMLRLGRTEEEMRRTHTQLE